MYMRLFVLILVANAQDLELDLDKSNWIDPTDMLYYDTVKRVMKNKPHDDEEGGKGEPKQTSGQANTDKVPNNSCDLEIERLKSKLEDCERRIVELKRNDEIEVMREDLPFVKRYVNQLMDHFSANDVLIQDYKVTVQLTTEDRLILSKFVSGDKANLHEVDEILSRYIIQAEATSFEGVATADWVTAINCEFLIVAVILCAAWIFMLKASVFKCALLFVLISTYWHWMHLYQQAVARRDAELAKLVDVPSECRPNNEPQSLLYKFGTLTINAIFGKNADSCAKYYKAVGVDPIWEVSPSLAFSEAISQFFTHPFGILGSNIGTFYYNLNDNLPWFSYYILLTATLVFAFFALMAVFKYRIRLPFGIASIEPSPTTAAIQTPSPAVTQPPQVRQVIQDVKRPEVGNFSEDRAESIEPHGICLPCQCHVDSSLVKRPVVSQLVHNAGAGDQNSTIGRENLEEIDTSDNKAGLNSSTMPPATMEAGDSSFLPANLCNSDPCAAAHSPELKSKW